MAVRSGTNRFVVGMAAVVLGAGVLALPATALAQRDDHHGGGGDRGGHQDGNRGAGGQHQGPGRPGQGNAGPADRGVRGPGQADLYRPASGNGNFVGNRWPGRPQPQNFSPRPGFQGQPGQVQMGNGGPGRNFGGQGGRYPGVGFDGGRYDGGTGHGQPGYGGGEPGGPGGGPQWNHGWRQDNRYDWRGWREENRDSFHVGRYYAPYRGYSYNRLSIGFYLQPMFFGSDYWIADPWYYRLPPAYGPYRWVRYYDDVLLVNVYNGQVVDVIYDFFW